MSRLIPLRALRTLLHPCPSRLPLPIPHRVATLPCAPRSVTSYRAAHSLSHAAPAIPAGGVRVIPPREEDMRKDEFWREEPEIKLVPEGEAGIVITEDAIRQLTTIATREPPSTPLALRVSVESGGCHGYQYGMDLTEERGVDDYVYQPPGECIPVIIDLVSLRLLKGATLHFATELIGSSFRLQDNPQAKDGGGCGCGVSWEAKAEV